MIERVAVAEPVDRVPMDSGAVGAQFGAQCPGRDASGSGVDWSVSPLRQNPRSMLHRVTAILSCFLHEWERLCLNDIVERTGLPRSTTHRILDSLVSLEWLTYDPPNYRLGGRPLLFAGQTRNHLGIRSAASPHLMELHERTGLVVTLSVIEGADTIVLDVVGARSRRDSVSRIGDRRMAFKGISGRAILSTMEPEIVDAVVQGHLPSRVGGTVWTRQRLHGELSRIRHRYGVSIERTTDSSRCAGAARAIPDRFGVTAAVSLQASSAVPAARRGVPKWPMPLLVDSTRRIADEVSRDRDAWV